MATISDLLSAEQEVPNSKRGGHERGRQRGFTLIEAIVSLAILVIVLVVSLSLLFTMRSFAEKQELVADARQTARRAVDYLSYYARGANDMRGSTGGAIAGTSSNSLVMWVNTPGAGGGVQAQVSFDNLGQGGIGPAGLADPGTDLITLAYALNARFIPVATWPGNQHAATITFNFRDGCPNDTQNMLLFEQLTGCTPASACDGSSPTGAGALSGNLTLTDANGNWCYYQITNYQSSSCGDVAGNVIQVVNNPGRSDMLNPPSGEPQLQQPVGLGAGVQYYSFRVKTTTVAPFIPQLEQKNAICDPTGALFGTADTGAGSTFVPILDNIEDLQIAYIFNDGTIANNNAAGQLPAAQQYVPTQAAIPVAGAKDISNVIGLRITVVARASQAFSPMDLARDRYPLLVAEDHTPVQPAAGNQLLRTFRYRLSATLMLRSRMFGE